MRSRQTNAHLQDRHKSIVAPATNASHTLLSNGDEISVELDNGSTVRQVLDLADTSFDSDCKLTKIRFFLIQLS